MNEEQEKETSLVNFSGYDKTVHHDKKHIDALSIGLFGLTVSAITLGLHQLGLFGTEDAFDHLAIGIMSLIFGGIVQIVAGFVEVRYDQQLGGTALTMYGFLWVGTGSLAILDAVQKVGPHPLVEIPLIATFAVFSAVMIYLTGMKNFVLMIMHIFITITLSLVVLAKFGIISETAAGVGHLLIGVTAFIEAMGVLVNEFTEDQKVPLGRAPIHPRKQNKNIS